MSAISHFISKGIRQTEIDEYLERELQSAGYGGVEIAKTPLGERITIHASRPGIVIGRRGKNIRTITDELKYKYGLENPQIEVKEVDNPELNARVMAYSLKSAVERGIHRRRAAYSVLRRVLNAGAKGCEVLVSGKLTSKRSRREAYRMGVVAKSGEVGGQYVSTAHATAIMKLGTIGLTVSVMRGDIAVPDEFNVLAVHLGEEKAAVPEGELKEEVTEEKMEEKVTEEVQEEKPSKKKEEKAKEIVEPIAEKTELDVKVEELSELIEKTPEVKAEPKEKPTPTKVKKAATKMEKEKKESKKPAKKEVKEKKPSKPAKSTKAEKKTVEKPKSKTAKKK